MKKKVTSRPEDTISMGYDRFLEQLPADTWRYLPHTFASVMSDKLWKPYPYIVMLSNIITTAIARGNGRILVSIPPRHGKQLAHDTPILTPDGWRKHGDLRPGDYVFGRNGQPVIVQGVSPETIGEYEVGFSDGTAIHCHENHEWVVYDRNAQKEKIIETKYLLEHSLSCEGERGKRGHRNRFQVDANTTIDFPEKNLPLHPYFFGVWLGDGRSTSPDFCGAADDVAVISDKLESLGYRTSSRWIHKDTGVHYCYYRDGIKKILRDLNVLNNKHIPDLYLFSSFQQRMEMLAGLVDTDGHRDPSGRYRISTCNEKITHQIKTLVNSLGGYCYIMKAEPVLSSSGVQGKQPVYQVGFNLPHILPVALERKSNKNIQYIHRRRAIVDVLKVSPNQVKPGRCIQVEGGIYLAGETMIPTHNSFFISQWLPVWFLSMWPHKRVLLSTYEANFAATWGRRARNIIKEKGERVGLFLADDATASNNWATTEGGGMVTAGVGGPITGKGCDLGIIDDPHKNWQEAQSPTILKSIHEWFDSTFYTRLEPQGTIVILHCLAEGSRVLSAEGWKNIEDLKSGEILWTFDGEKMIREQMKELVPQGEDDIFQVQTVRKSIESNARHPFLVIKKIGQNKRDWVTEWKQLKDLQVGDYVLTLKSLPSRSGTHYRVPGSRKFMENDFLWLLGMMIGDGWVTEFDRKGGPNGNTKNSFAVCIAKGINEEVNEKICSIVEKYFGRRPTLTKFGYYRLDSYGAGKMLKYRAGVIGGAKGKRLAPWIFKLRPDGKREFLRGLFEADGCQRKSKATKKSKRYVPSWSYACANRELVEDVRELALTCGMRPSKIYICRQTTQPPNSKQPIESTIYRTDVTDRHQRYELKTIFNCMKRTTFFQTRPEKITSITNVGRKPVYDVVMDGKHENFIANGFIVHNTRWSENDLIGYLLREKISDGWFPIRIPAIGENYNGEEDPLGREEGEALCPQRYNEEALNRIKSNMTAQMWNALFQQRPAPQEGSIFLREKWKYYRVAPKCTFILQSWDTASKTNWDSAYSVCQTWGISDVGAVLLGQWRDKVEYPQLRRQAEMQYSRFHPNVVLIEDKDSGKALIQALRQETTMPVLGIIPDVDKVIRAQAVSPMQESGRAWLPDPTDPKHPENSWVVDFVDNCTTFPNSFFKDEIDTMSQALAYIMLMAGGGKVMSFERRKSSLLLEDFRRLM